MADTPVHSIRIDGALWARAHAKARRNGTSITRLIRVWLAVYAERD